MKWLFIAVLVLTAGWVESTERADITVQARLEAEQKKSALLASIVIACLNGQRLRDGEYEVLCKRAAR